MDHYAAAVQGAIMLLGGLVLCFRGRALFSALLPLVGFVLFGLAAMVIAQPYAHGNLAYLAGAGVLGGLLGALLMWAAFLYGLFLVGAAFGSHLGALAAARMGYDPSAIVLVCALLGGLAAVLAENLLVVLATAMWGAMFVVSGYLIVAGRLFPGHLLDPRQLVALGQRHDIVPQAWLLLAIVGAVIQLVPDRRAVVVR